MSKKPNTERTEASPAMPEQTPRVRKVAPEIEAQIDEALGLQAISIRLQKSTIDTYKMLAKMHGVGYQPLMRDAICRWAEAELKQLLIGAVETQRQETAKAAQLATVAVAGAKRSATPPVKRAA